MLLGGDSVNKTTQLYYIHNDHLGTPKALTDDAGQLVWKATASPFGKATVNNDVDGDGSAVEFNIRHPGQYYDAESGLFYNYFRYYDAETGRYVTSDPIGLAGGINTYSYVENNPLNYIDPLGLRGTPLSAIAGYIGRSISKALGSGNSRTPPPPGAFPSTHPDGWPTDVPRPEPYNNENKKTRKKIKGLQDHVDKHKDKITNAPDSRDVPGWKVEIKAGEDRIKRLKKRLPGCKTS